MSEVNETVREVCAELMKMANTHHCEGWQWSRSAVIDLNNSILAAYEREMAAKDAEIDRLKAALKPVMNINLDGLHEYAGIDYGNLLSSVIAEAQRIMKEGGAK